LLILMDVTAETGTVVDATETVFITNKEVVYG